MRLGKCWKSESVGKVEAWRMGLWEEMRTQLGNLGCYQRAREIGSMRLVWADGRSVARAQGEMALGSGKIIHSIGLGN